MEFGLITEGAPVAVIAVLFPVPEIKTRRLDVSVRRPAYPNVVPGGRDRQCFDPLKMLFVFYGLITQEIHKLVSPFFACDARCVSGNVNKMSCLSRFAGIFIGQ